MLTRTLVQLIREGGGKRTEGESKQCSVIFAAGCYFRLAGVRYLRFMVAIWCGRFEYVAGVLREYLREWIMAIRYVSKCQGRYYLCFQVSMEGLGCWEVRVCCGKGLVYVRDNRMVPKYVFRYVI